MVVLDGRCLCVGKCCCLDLPVPALQKRQEDKSFAPPSLQVSKAFSQRSIESDASTRADGRFSRASSSHYGSDYWHADEETVGFSLFRTRRFVAIPSAFFQKDDTNEEDRQDNSPEKKRESLRRKFLHDEGTCHF
mmetsp:Transcript_11659/g.22186  ORF Transcript_11659/g.22186 Transcript_11659/m.22186 type:complete len:135 (-) Transcript_11659:30-434(-)